MIPDWWEAVILAAAAWRIWHLLAEDVILDGPREKIIGRLSEKWQDFIDCPYCLGFHLSLVVYLFWVWLPTMTLAVCIPFALNAGVITLHKMLNSD